MTNETILVILMGVFLLLLFLVGIASDAVAMAVLPAASREEVSSNVTAVSSHGRVSLE
jgi:hypothetical protein